MCLYIYNDIYIAACELQYALLNRWSMPTNTSHVSAHTLVRQPVDEPTATSRLRQTQSYFMPLCPLSPLEISNVVQPGRSAIKKCPVCAVQSLTAQKFWMTRRSTSVPRIRCRLFACLFGGSLSTCMAGTPSKASGWHHKSLMFCSVASVPSVLFPSGWDAHHVVVPRHVVVTIPLLQRQPKSLVKHVARCGKKTCEVGLATVVLLCQVH